MTSLVRRLAVFLLGVAVGCGFSAILRTVAFSPTDGIPALEVNKPGEIQEIAMEVIYDWCGGKHCPDYKIIFQREGRENYYSSVTRVGLQSHEVKNGDIAKVDFDKLAQVLESQSFFELDPVYPKNTGCADCVITKVTALRDGRRKKVVHLTDDMPLQLWTVHRMLEGMETRVMWLEH